MRLAAYIAGGAFLPSAQGWSELFYAKAFLHATDLTTIPLGE
jgi:hypothetical protein